jgi:hypothetical protein
LFDFDGRGMRSLWLLITRPGQLTSLYLAGRRASFVPPVRLYLFVSLIFFSTIWATGTAIFQFGHATNAAGGHSTTVSFFAPLNPAPPTGKPRLTGERQIDINGEAPDWVKRLIDGVERAFAEPRALNERLSELFPKMMFALVPFFALVFWLLYVRRRRFLIEHLVFALHFHTFAFLLATILIAGRAILLPSIPGAAFFLPAAVYLLVAMKQVYAQGWLKTGIKELILLSLYGLGFVGGMGALIFAGLSEI